MSDSNIQTTIHAADEAGANVIAILSELISQPASIYAVVIAFGFAYLYSLFVDFKVSKRERRRNKAVITILTAAGIFLVFQEQYFKETYVVATAVGFLAMLIPLAILKLLEAYAPKLAHALEPDEKKSYDHVVSRVSGDKNE